jgi:hypothetical protein
MWRAGGTSCRERFCFALTIVALSAGLMGCGSSTTTAKGRTADVVSVAVVSPTNGSVIAADHVMIRGTVNPANAVVQIQGNPAAVGNGVFTGTATLHGGTTTIDVIGSAVGATPGSAKVSITRLSNKAPAQTITRTVAVPSSERAQPASPEPEHTFFAPGGNVTCVIQGDSASCSVASADITFVLPLGGGAAYTTAGQEVARGSGVEAAFGTEQSNGTVTCTIPPSNVPAGISCRDNSSAHGFEASRVPARQKVH